jgi:hypothetical protein
LIVIPKVMFFEEQGKRVLIAMIAAPLMAHPDGFIERHLAVSGYPPEDLQSISVHAGLSLLFMVAPPARELETRTLGPRRSIVLQCPRTGLQHWHDPVVKKASPIAS